MRSSGKRRRAGRAPDAHQNFMPVRTRGEAEASPLVVVVPIGRRYGSMRTMVGFGNPVMPPYATDPRYFVPGANPVNVRLIVPVAPSVAVAGALTAMFPAVVDPSSQLNSVKLAVPGAPTAKPWT